MPQPRSPHRPVSKVAYRACLRPCKLAEQLPAETRAGSEQLLAVGFADGGGRGWADAARGGWVDGHGGGFVNRNAWGNGWGDGGGFANWRNY